MRLLVLFFAVGVTLFSQNYKPTFRSNPNLKLDSVLAGVKYVVVHASEEYQKKLDDGERKEYENAARSYLEFLGFESIGLTTKEKNIIFNSISSYCDVIRVGFYWEFPKDKIFLKLRFYTCNDDRFEFETSFLDKSSSFDTNQQLFDVFLAKWKQLYRRDQKYYNVKHRLSLPKLPTNWTEKSLKEYFNGPQVDSLEGIYEKMRVNAEDAESKYKIAVIKTDNLSYNVIYLSGANHIDDWQEGEIKAVLYKAAIPNYYKVDWYMLDKKLNKEVYLQRTQDGILEFLFSYSGPASKSSYLKTYPVKW